MGYKHGMRYTSTYNSWVAMKKRCDNTNEAAYPAYGGRGISYDPAWSEFKNFYADLGNCPEGLTLERNDTNGNYCKSNCRWATRGEQNRNKRVYKNSQFGLPGITHDGRYYHANCKIQGKQVRLYHGPDFFEACCARKSFDGIRAQGFV